MSTGRRRRRGPHAPGEPFAHAECREGDPRIHRAASMGMRRRFTQGAGFLRPVAPSMRRGLWPCRRATRGRRLRLGTQLIWGIAASKAMAVRRRATRGLPA
jgi:hypothetical protein